ncbi:hypothetical protein AOLI_G00241040 [Acnodon oligacanthus]
MHNMQGPNCPNATTGPALDDHGVEGVGKSTEAFKIRSQVKLEALDSSEEDEKQPLTMASNSIFETFSSYQSCFARASFMRDLWLSPGLMSFTGGWSRRACILVAECLPIADSGYQHPQAP